MKIQFEWEEVCDNTWRARVFGGWIVQVTEDVGTAEGETTELCVPHRTSMVFVPDADCEWEL